MPPIIALIICIAFVLMLLRLERKQSPDVSFALWIPTIWMLVISSKPLAIWFGTGGSDMNEGSYLDRIFMTGLGCIGLIIIAYRRCSWWNLIKNNIWVPISLLFMLISISWSDIPFVSFKRWSREIIAIIMCLFVATEKYPYQAFQSIMRRAIYILMPVSLLLIKYYPHLGVNYSNAGNTMWMGVKMHKNGLSILCAVFIVFLIWTWIRRRRGLDKIVVWYQTYVEVFLLLLTIYIFMGPKHVPTNSATSFISLTIAMTALVGLSWMKKHGKIISGLTLSLIVGSIIFYGTLTPFLGGLVGVNISEFVNRDETLTGRNIFWARLIPYVMDKPFMGYGFGGFWTDAMRDTIGEAHPHNGYLDILLNIGFIGLILISLFLIKNCWNVKKEMTKNFDRGILWLCFLIITIFHNFAEVSASSFEYTNIALLLFLGFVTAADCLKTNQNKNVPE